MKSDELHIVRRSYNLLSRELCQSKKTFMRQPNGRLRYLSDLSSDAASAEHILAFAREQMIAAQNGSVVKSQSAFLDFWTPESICPDHFWGTWKYHDFETRRATANVIGRQMRRDGATIAIDSVLQCLQGTPHIDSVAASELREISMDIVSLISSERPPNVAIKKLIWRTLGGMGFQCRRAGYCDVFDHVARRWTGFFELGKRGEPSQAKFYFRIKEGENWLDVYPLHLNVGMRYGVPSMFAWDQIRTDTLDELVAALESLVGSIDKVVDGSCSE